MNILIPCDNFGPAMTPADHPPFKTLYLLNGHSGSKNDWLLSGDVQNVSNLYDIAIVIPSGDNSFYTDNPYYEQLYSEFIGHELVNYTRSILPLSCKREDTYIAGLSMGGYGTIHNSMRHSDVFGHAIALSTPFEDFYKEATDEPNFMGITKSYYVSLFGPEEKFDTSDANLKFLAKKTHESGCDVPDLYIACGYNDKLVHGNRDYHNYLVELGVPHFYEEGPGTHEWDFWAPFLKKGLDRSIKAKDAKAGHPFWIERDEEGVR